MRMNLISLWVYIDVNYAHTYLKLNNKINKSSSMESSITFKKFTLYHIRSVYPFPVDQILTLITLNFNACVFGWGRGPVLCVGVGVGVQCYFFEVRA